VAAHTSVAKGEGDSGLNTGRFHTLRRVTPRRAAAGGDGLQEVVGDKATALK